MDLEPLVHNVVPDVVRQLEYSRTRGKERVVSVAELGGHGGTMQGLLLDLCQAGRTDPRSQLQVPLLGVVLVLRLLVLLVHLSLGQAMPLSLSFLLHHILSTSM